jgi:hypothetical protein
VTSFTIILKALTGFFSCCFCDVESGAYLVKVFPVGFGIVDVSGTMGNENFSRVGRVMSD